MLWKENFCINVPQFKILFYLEIIQIYAYNVSNTLFTMSTSVQKLLTSDYKSIVVQRCHYFYLN
jgi:hypothetical protein